MRLGKIALWVFIALVLSGLIFGISLFSDVQRMGGWNNTVIGVGQQYEVNDKESFDLNGITRIEIDMASSDTYLAVSSGNQLTAALTGQVRTTNAAAVSHMKTERSGNTLKIYETRVNFSIGFYSSNVRLDVSIPEGFDGDMVITSSSGDVYAPGLDIASLTLETTSGDMELGTLAAKNGMTLKSSSGACKADRLSASEVFIESTSGDKSIKSVSASGNVTVNSSSGETIIDGMTCNKLVVNSTSGDTTIGLVKASSTDAESSSGAILIKALEGSARLEGSSGNITVTCTKPKETISIATSSGEIVLALPENPGFKLGMSTNSGELATQFKLNSAEQDEDYIRGTFGSGEMDVSLKSSSGDITVNRN